MEQLLEEFLVAGKDLLEAKDQMLTASQRLQPAMEQMLVVLEQLQTADNELLTESGDQGHQEDIDEMQSSVDRMKAERLQLITVKSHLEQLATTTEDLLQAARVELESISDTKFKKDTEQKEIGNCHQSD